MRELIFALVLFLAITFVVSDEACTECCETIEVCECEVSGATLTLSGFVNAADVEMGYRDGAISNDAVCYADPPLASGCEIDVDSCYPIDDGTPDGFTELITQRCRLENLNGAWATSDINPTTLLVSHHLGTQNSLSDRGVLIEETQIDSYLCCVPDGPESCDELSFHATYYKRVYVWKMTYGLECLECLGGDKWISIAASIIDSAATITLHKQTVYDYSINECQLYINGIYTTIDEESGALFSGNTPINNFNVALLFTDRLTGLGGGPACQMTDPDSIDLYRLPLPYNEECLDEIPYTEEDCCYDPVSCVSCSECVTDCYGTTLLASSHEDCPELPNLMEFSGCDQSSLDISGTLEVA